MMKRHFHNWLNAVSSYGWFLLGLTILAWAVWINRFPEGVIVAGGDVLQLLHLREIWEALYYDWFGRAALFYAFFSFLNTMGVSDNGQLSWYVGVFLFGSYGSFYFFTRLVFPKVLQLIAVVTSLLYATNVYTLYIFTATWGFTHYQVLYVFVPILTGWYMYALAHRSDSLGIRWFIFSAALASMSFGNPAFALSLAVFFLILTVNMFIVDYADMRSCWRFVTRRIIIMGIGALAVNAYWVMPLLPQVRQGVDGVTASTEIVLVDALRKTSNAFYDTIRLLPTHESNLYYPQNFPYPSLDFLQPFSLILAFIPFLFILVMFIRRNGVHSRKMQILFLLTFCMMAIGVAHVRFPFEGLNNFIFQLPGLNVLRGWDKLAIFMPFLLGALVLNALAVWQDHRRTRRIAALICFVLTIAIALPWYGGGLQTKLSYILAGSSKKDYRTADYTALVLVPQVYNDVKPLLDQDKENVKISRLPFAAGSSVGRINLPVWGINAPAPERVLYNKEYIEPTEVYFDKWLFAQSFKDSRYDPEWIVDWYGLIGVRYVIWHKDARREEKEAMMPALRYLIQRQRLSAVADNKWFTMYRIDDPSVFPLVYASSGTASLYPSVFGLSEKVTQLRSRISPIVSQRVNPQKIVVSNIEVGANTRITLNEKYNPLWMAEWTTKNGQTVTLVRDESIRYANAWNMETSLGEGSVEIFFKPVRSLYIGTGISGGALAITILSAFVVARRKKSGK